MHKPIYIYRSRHNIYYFRWPIPSYLHPQGKTGHVKVSLGTREPKEALRLASFLEYHALLITQHGNLVYMDYANIRKAVQGYLSKALRERKAEIDRQGPYSASQIAGLASSAALISQAIEYDDNTLIEPLIPQERVHAVSEEYSLGIIPNTPQYKILEDVLRIGLRDLTREVISYSQSREQFNFNDNIRLSHIPTPPEAGDTLGPAIDKFIAEKKMEGKWTSKTETERGYHLALLVEILGESFDLSLLDSRKAREVKDIIKELPANRNKIGAVKGLNVFEAIKVGGVAKIGIATINQYLHAYNSFCDWAKDNGYLKDNPFSGLALDDSKKSNKKDAFTDIQIKAILGELMKGKDGIARKDHQYWGTLIGIYTGARVNEIASLEVNDIKQEDGIWYFDLNDEGEQKYLKTESSKRRVPVHSALIEAGLIEYTQSLRKQGKDRLFHELSYCPKNGYGRNLGRWFNDTLLSHLALKEAGRLSFHSLRHTVVTKLRQAGVELPIVQTLVGHRRVSITEAVYNKGYTMQQLSDALEKLTF